MNELTPTRKPEPHECCGTGCIPCVMDIYEEELYEYEKAIKRIAADSAPAGVINLSGPGAQQGTSALDPV